MAGNDAASFTTGMNSVPAVTNNSTVAPTAPGAPTGLTATVSGSTRINLGWTAPASDGGSVIIGYRIEVSSDGGSSWTDLIANTGSTVPFYFPGSLAPGTTRHYRVSAINAIGTGATSNVANATTLAAPGAPTGLVATASGTTQINLTWTAPASSGVPITGYRIEVSSDAGSSWTDLVANTSSTTTTYAHTGLAAGTTRHYRVSAINTIGTGTASNVDSATTGNTAPTVANTIPGPDGDGGHGVQLCVPGQHVQRRGQRHADLRGDESRRHGAAHVAVLHRRHAHLLGTPQAADVATVSVKVTASDGNGGSVSDEFDITVAADTTPPTLTSATVTSTGQIIEVQFSENLGRSNLPRASDFDVTAGGSDVTVSLVASTAALNVLWVVVTPAIRQGQAVVVTYTDPTAGDDVRAIQDVAGNDAASFTTGMNSVPAVTNNSTVPAEVPADWSLKPTGLNTGARFRLLFLSSTKRDATATAIATYNTFVQSRAAAGHTDIQAYSAGFRAVGCTAAVDARDNTSTTYTTTDKGVPIYWLNGAQAADQYEDFYDGSWDDEANDKNESGTDGPDTSQNANFPFTGCDHDGTESFSSGTSRALGANRVRLGSPNSAVSNVGPLSNPNIVSVVDIDAARPMYGLSGVFQVGAAPSLTSAAIDETGQLIQLQFSENLQSSNLPPASAFTVTSRRHRRHGLRRRSGEHTGWVADLGFASHRPGPGRRCHLHRPHDRQRRQRHPEHRRQRRRLLHHRHEQRPRRHQQLHRPRRGPRGLEPQAHRAEHRRQVPAAVPLLNQARRHRHRHRDVQHLRPEPRRGRPHRYPGLQRGLQGGRLHRRRRRPRQHLHHLHTTDRASPSTGSTAPRPPTSTRISTTGPGTTRPTTRTSPAPTRTTPSCEPTGPSPAARTTAPRRSCGG